MMESYFNMMRNHFESTFGTTWEEVGFTAAKAIFYGKASDRAEAIDKALQFHDEHAIDEDWGEIQGWCDTYVEEMKLLQQEEKLQKTS